MASTRDKRLKTDSPTPLQANDAAATTPTTKAATTAIKLKRMSRNRSGILSVKADNEDGNDSVGLSEDTQSSTASADVTKTPNTRTKRQLAKDEKEEEANGDVKEIDSPTKEGPRDPETPRTRKLTKAQTLKKKGAELALARRQALMKRKSLPLPVKSSGRIISRRLSGGAAKPTETAKDEDKTAVVVKKVGRPPRKPAAEVKEVEAQKTEVDEETESLADAEIESETAEIMDKSEETLESDAILDINIKHEKNISPLDLLNVRRSTRQRKSTIKDRDSPFTGKKSHAREKFESKRDSISPALSNASIKAEKDSSKAISITVDQTEAAEKDPSLSPELVSEEMDTESVQHLYDKPDFLENNLGIEQDPKLGAIVNVQEKTKVVESVIKSDEVPITADDIEMEKVENEKSEEKVEKVNGEKTVEEDAKAPEKPDSDIKKEPIEEEIKLAGIVANEADSAEENKENKVESSAKSVGSGSPRSEDRLKTVSEENVPKLDPIETELLMQKESHLMSLGLLTHKAADEAILAKQKRKEELLKSQVAQPTTGRSSKSKKDSSGEHYTGTLKTIIKLNRTEKEKRKTRMPLKMTFQKKNRDRDSNGSSNSSDSFYTIQEVRTLDCEPQASTN